MYYQNKILELNEDDTEFGPTLFDKTLLVKQVDEFTFHNESPMCEYRKSQLNVNDKQPLINPLQSEEDMDNPVEVEDTHKEKGSSKDDKVPLIVSQSTKVESLLSTMAVKRSRRSETATEPEPVPSLDLILTLSHISDLLQVLAIKKAFKDNKRAP